MWWVSQPGFCPPHTSDIPIALPRLSSTVTLFSRGFSLTLAMVWLCSPKIICVKGVLPCSAIGGGALVYESGLQAGSKTDEQNRLLPLSSDRLMIWISACLKTTLAAGKKPQCVKMLPVQPRGPEFEFSEPNTKFTPVEQISVNTEFLQKTGSGVRWSPRSFWEASLGYTEETQRGTLASNKTES